MATVTIIVVSIWQNIGFLMIIYTAGLQTIPKDVMESAELDGCSGLKKSSGKSSFAAYANCHDQSVCFYFRSI